MAKKSGCMSFNILYVGLVAALLAVLFWLVFYGPSKTTREGLTNNKEFVLVHMNKCPHCVNLMPHWEAAESENKTGINMRAESENKTGINMRAVEMSEDDGPELCEKHNITGFPTMILLENGKKVADYDGERNKEGILAFLKGL